MYEDTKGQPSRCSVCCCIICWWGGVNKFTARTVKVLEKGQGWLIYFIQSDMIKLDNVLCTVGHFDFNLTVF